VRLALGVSHFLLKIIIPRLGTYEVIGVSLKEGFAGTAYQILIQAHGKSCPGGGVESWKSARGRSRRIDLTVMLGPAASEWPY
jgi:hypothetical protein